MVRFQYAEYLWFLALVPIAIFLYVHFLSWRTRKIKKIGDPQLVMRLFKGRIPGRVTTQFVLLLLAFIAIILGLANLQAAGKAEKVERKGLDIMFALDVSNSMLARDIAPDRISNARQFIFSMIEKMQNDRVGLVVFAGKSYLQIPLTIDYSAFNMILSSVNPGMIPSQGTVLANAIELSSKSFKESDTKHKAIVLISDGEDHDSKAESAAKKAAESGTVIYTVGIGSPQGSVIFDPSTGQNKVDMNGQTVITKLNEKELQNLASITGGSYIQLSNVQTTATHLLKEINKLEAKSLGEVSFTNYKSYFQYFLAAALLFLLMAWLLPVASSFSKNKSLLSNTQ